MSQFGAFCLGLILSALSGVWLFKNAVGKGRGPFVQSLLNYDDLKEDIIHELRRRGYSVMRMGYQQGMPPFVHPPCTHDHCLLLADGTCHMRIAQGEP